ncbi:uncharacterized protein DMENIID0001_062280 [Sergentomyia squamirostris]
MNLIEEFVGNVLEELTGQRDKGWNLIVMRKPTEKISFGDFSFHTDIRCWREFGAPGKCEKTPTDIFTHLGIDFDVFSRDLIIKSHKEEWNLPIERMEMNKSRCIIFLDRKESFRKVISHVLNPKPELKQVIAKKTVFLEALTESSQTLTDFRGILLRKILINLIQRSRRYTQVSQRQDAIMACSIVMKSSQEIPPGDVKILPGTVLDSVTRRKSPVTSYPDYLEQKVKECELVARHRYGYRGPGDAEDQKKFENMGRASLTLELMEAKHSSPVACGESASRSGAFILYNSARMETLLETFQRRNFPETLELSEVDFSLLAEPEEWILLINFIASEEWIVEKSLGELEKERISPHLIVSELHSLVNVFSAYYRRVQILTDNRHQLLPTVHARILLLRALRKVFNRILQLLEIDPVAKM